jgi:radical SAM protein with 4Fe4S-binding SPASM domain
MTFEGFPVVIGLELTLACNLKCRHCASSAGNPRPDELSLDEMIAICDQFPALLVKEVDLTGGEPLMRTDWPLIATHLSELQIPVRMVSNGLLLKDNVSRLKEVGMATVGVSIDGLETTHDAIRQRPGLFARVVEGVKAGLEAGIPIAALTAVNDWNVDELPELLIFLRNLGIRHWQVQPTFALGRAAEGNLSLSDASFIKLGEFVKAHLAKCESEGFDIMPADGVGYYSELDTRQVSWKGCPAGLASCGITSDGKVKGCISHPHHLVEGDLRCRDLWSIWFDENSFSYNRHFATQNLGKACKDCSHGEQCRGGCLVMSYAATGQFHNDPFCFHGILSRREANDVDRGHE